MLVSPVKFHKTRKVSAHLEGDGLAREGLHEDLHGGADLPDF